MPGTTIATSTSIPVRLTAASQGALLVTATGTVAPPGAAYGVLVASGVVTAIVNSGRIAADHAGAVGVYLAGTATVTNGAAGAPAASIVGYLDGIYVGPAGATAITNLGTVAATGTESVGVLAVNTDRRIASIVNGSAADTAARIAGATQGIADYGAGLDLTNFGTVTATQTFSPSGTGRGTGVVGWGPCRIVNGTAADTAASIAGYFAGVVLQGPRDTVTNFGTIAARDEFAFQAWAAVGQAIALHDGGTVVNGSAGDRAATLTGAGSGVDATQRAGFITNFGTIVGTDAYYGAGIVLEAGGAITNGSAADPAAQIIGRASFGVDLGGPLPSLVRNDGTIAAPGDAAIRLRGGGAVLNGAPGAGAALLTGRGGIYAAASVSVVNDGRILATGTSGIDLFDGGTVTNAAGARIAGAASAAGIAVAAGNATIGNAGVIAGGIGVAFASGGLVAGGTVSNAGTIASLAGAAGTAIAFGAGDARLIVAPGGVFVGRVLGGSGASVLELAAGTAAGSIAGIGTLFRNFGTLAVDAGADWTLAGPDTIATLTGGGTLGLAAGATLDVASVVGDGPAIRFLAAGRLAIDTAQVAAGQPIERFGTGDAIDLRGIAPSGLALSFVSAAGLLTLSRGGSPVATLAFATDSLGAGSFHLGQDGGGGTLLTRG